MEEISIHEARTVLQKLVRERKSLEKALEAADKLSDIEINIANRQQVLADVTAMVDNKQREWEELDAAVSEIHQRREAACVQREQEAQAKVAQLTEQRDLLRESISALAIAAKKQEEDLAIAHADQVAANAETIEHMKLRISALKSELGELQAQARRLVNG